MAKSSLLFEFLLVPLLGKKTTFLPHSSHQTARNIYPCLDSPLLELKCILRNPFDTLALEGKRGGLSTGPAGTSPSGQVPGQGASRTSGVLEERPGQNSLQSVQQWGGFPDLQDSPTGLCFGFLNSPFLKVHAYCQAFLSVLVCSDFNLLLQLSG